jgi:hypothetical protein
LGHRGGLFLGGRRDVLGGLIAWVLLDARRQQRLLAQLEVEGVTRRSAKRRRSGSGGAKEARR